ncbi:16S rRNA (cytosine(1402)-N(4))-methyltransferase RsmH [Bacteriovoracaceae bacterium]|nr:16S rRNA (cytosine(1402)-N(4))-methyltransferase RsmH [Bacteriovoracaceae bacterium]
MEYKKHYSVMLEELVTYVAPQSNENQLILDLTFGGGGHTVELAKRYPQAKILAVDQDPEAFENGQKRIKEEGLEDRIDLRKGNFSNVIQIHELEKDSLDGVIADLGVSSHHFDSPERGFSFRFEGPLDMRMDVDNTEITAADVLNDFSAKEIEEILSSYAQERFSRRIAENIVEKRKEEKFENTKQLENLVFHCYPKKMRFGKTHPATKTFQALRIYVNRELDVISETIPQLIDYIKPGGSFAIISFHSLEDRIVKTEFRKMAKEMGIVDLISKKPLLPTENEIIENSRSRSAKLRVVKKKS